MNTFMIISISNPKRQEHLYATYSTTEPDFWKRLSEQAQFDFRKSNQKSGKCIEARELIIALPESIQQFNPKFLLKTFTEKFREKYGVQCTSALHHNKAMTNYQIHLIFSDREALEQPEIKYAARNMFYDENGRHVRTKKEIQNADKTIRSGCKIIPKGEAYEVRYFSGKQDRFKEKSFLREVKGMYTELINECVSDEKDKLQVFDKAGPYLPTKKIGKNNPKAKEIEADNALRKEWNNTVDQVLIAGGTPEEVVEFKKEYVTEKVAESIRRDENQFGIFAVILQSAIEVLKTVYRFLMFRLEKTQKGTGENTMPEPPREAETAPTFDPAELQRAKADYMLLQTLHEDLTAMNRKIYAIEKTIQNLNRQLKRLENGFTDKVMHIFDRKELRKKITTEKEKLENARARLQLFPAQHGYSSVGELEQAYQVADKRYRTLCRIAEDYYAEKRSGRSFSDRGSREAGRGYETEDSNYDKSLWKGTEVDKYYAHTENMSIEESNRRNSGGRRKTKTSVLMKLAEKQSILEESRSDNRRDRLITKSQNGIEL